MRIALFGAIGVGLALASTGTFAAKKPAATHAAAKPAPSCAALAFRPLPGGTPDGEQTAGMYKSRLARFELRGTVRDGAAANYYLMANGARIAAAQSVPPAAADCAVAKKMPRPGAASASCTGDRFTVVIAHAGDKRFALLYAQNGGAASFCEAGSFDTPRVGPGMRSGSDPAVPARIGLAFAKPGPVDASIQKSCQPP